MAINKDIHTIIWSPRSLRSYEAIIDSIRKTFGEVAIQKFVRRTMKILELVSRDPSMFRRSDMHVNKHIVLVTPKTMLYYRVKPRRKQVELLLFWDARRNPDRLKY